MKKFIIISFLTFIFSSLAMAQSSESTLPFRFEKKEVKGFMKLNKTQLPKSALSKGMSLCSKYDYTSDNDLTTGQSIDGNILYRFTSKNNEETAIITDENGKLIEAIVYLNEEFKPYQKITDIADEKEYNIYANHGEFGAATKYITPKESWIELVTKKKDDSKSPVYILFFDSKLKFLREEDKE